MSSETHKTTSSLQSLSISSKPNTSQEPTKLKSKSKPVAESWEDEADSSSSSSAETETEKETLDTPSRKANTISSSGISGGASAPPPTPLTPTKHAREGEWGFDSPYSISSSTAGGPLTPLKGNFRPDSRSTSGGDTGVEDRRPEKSTAVAARMIAAGLGVRAPRKTEEMIKYEKSVREKEERRRRQEREEKEMADAARKAAWDD